MIRIKDKIIRFINEKLLTIIENSKYLLHRKSMKFIG